MNDGSGELVLQTSQWKDDVILGKGGRDMLKVEMRDVSVEILFLLSHIDFAMDLCFASNGRRANLTL